MKVIILCGGRGTRLKEETEYRPKPMVEIGGKPILWHIMKIYSVYGFDEFVLALGYKKEVIKQYFLNYRAMQQDLTIKLGSNEVKNASNPQEDWTIHMIDTGDKSMTGGRLHRLKPYLEGETFLLTYGDGVANINIRKLVEFHHSHRKLATVTAVHPVARFGEMKLDGARVCQFKEKPQTREGQINGGFFVFEPGVFEYLHGDDTVLEEDPLENLAHDGQLMAYCHDGFWYCMDTIRDLEVLEKLWSKGNAPWKVW